MLKLQMAKFRVGWGNAALMVTVDTKSDPNEDFPDGCKPELVYEKGGLVLRLLNRDSGVKWSRKRVSNSTKFRDSWQMTVHAKFLDTDVARFGSVTADSVESMVGGLLIRLPTDRPPVKSMGSPKPSKTKAVSAQPAPDNPKPESAPTKIEALSPEQNLELAREVEPPVSRKETRLERPSGDLLLAVDIVNQWKDFLGEKLVVSLSPDGKIGVLAQHGAA